MPGGIPVKLSSNPQSEQVQPLSTQATNLSELREKILNWTLVGVTIFGTISLASNLLPSIGSQEWLLVSFLSVIYLWIIFITINRRLAYPVRAITLTFIPLGLGIIDFLQNGFFGNGSIWLLAAVFLASTLLGIRWSLSIWLLGITSLIIFAYLFTSDKLVISEPIRASGSWLEITIDFLLLGGIIFGSLSLLLGRLEKSLAETQDLTSNLAQDRTKLEKHTTDLEHRLNQIRAVADISRIISSQLASKELLQKVVDLIQERLNLYFVGVFIIDKNHQYAELQAGSSQTGRIMLSEGFKLRIGGESLIGWSIANHQPRISLDIHQEAVRFVNPDLPLTKSELALLLNAGDQIIGAISIQSTEPQAFDKDDIKMLQSLADSLVVAIENARLFQENQTQLEELNTLYNASHSMITAPQRQELLKVISSHMLSSSETQVCTISGWDPEANEVFTEFAVSTRDSNVLDEIGDRYKLHDFPLTERVILEQITTTIRTDDPDADPAEVDLMEKIGLKSLLMLPMVAYGKVIGLLKLEDMETCRDFTPIQIRMVEALSTQAAAVLENSRILEQAQNVVSRERVINQIAANIQESMDIENILTNTIKELSKALGLEEAAIKIGTEPELLRTFESGSDNGQEG